MHRSLKKCGTMLKATKIDKNVGRLALLAKLHDNLFRKISPLNSNDFSYM